MLRKIVMASTLGLFLATSVVSPASAATTKTGTSCTKAGKTQKVGSKTYVCGKNPLVTPTRNTYMLKACRDTYALYKPVKATYDAMMEQAKNFKYENLTDLGNDLGGNEKVELDNLVALVTKAESNLALQCKKGA